jgi:hypothetical protein
MRWMREEVRHQKYRYDPRSPDGGGIDLAVIAATRPVASILTLARS